MIAVKPARGGYLVRVRTREGVKILGPYPTPEEAMAVRLDAMRQVRLGRKV